MRNCVIIAIISALIFTSCQSKEEKAAELIKAELSKTLYDFDSYEPIKTTVTEAYNTANNDSSCIILASTIMYGM
jgi:MFS superfamily sulfate permease-like transporter